MRTGTGHPLTSATTVLHCVLVRQHTMGKGKCTQHHHAYMVRVADAALPAVVRSVSLLPPPALPYSPARPCLLCYQSEGCHDCNVVHQAQHGRDVVKVHLLASEGGVGSVCRGGGAGECKAPPNALKWGLEMLSIDQTINQAVLDTTTAAGSTRLAG